MSTLTSNPSYGRSSRKDRGRFSFSFRTFQPAVVDHQSTSAEGGGPFEGAARAEGAMSHQPRKLFLKVGLVSAAAGSAYVEFGNTKVMCSVYGPRPVKTEVKAMSNQFLSSGQTSSSAYAQTSTSKCLAGVGVRGPKAIFDAFSDKATVQCDFTYATFCDSDHALQDGQEKLEMELEVSNVLELLIMREKYPKSMIQVNLLVLEDDGSAFTSAINCANVALVQAGILMYDMVAACSVPLFPADASSASEKKPNGSVHVAYSPVSKQIVHLAQVGESDLQTSLQGISTAISGCLQIYEKMRELQLHQLTNHNNRQE